MNELLMNSNSSSGNIGKQIIFLVKVQVEIGCWVFSVVDQDGMVAPVVHNRR